MQVAMITHAQNMKAKRNGIPNTKCVPRGIPRTTEFPPARSNHASQWEYRGMCSARIRSATTPGSRYHLASLSDGSARTNRTNIAAAETKLARDQSEYLNR